MLQNTYSTKPSQICAVSIKLSPQTHLQQQPTL